MPNRLIEAKDVVYECGPNCGCGPACVNRTSQQELRYRFEVCIVIAVIIVIDLVNHSIFSCINRLMWMHTGFPDSKEGVGCQIMGLHTCWIPYM